jgi:carbamate kinase
MAETLVISLGGNAFAAAGEALSMAGQFAFAAKTLAPLAEPLATDQRFLITHGNGPQVGYILTRVEEALGKAYSLPLEVCVAESEGEIGYVLQQTLHNLTGGRRPVATLLTQVLVDPEDPAFATPDKPIGPWFEAEQAAQLADAGLPLVYDRDGRGRRVVASPAPLGIIEIDIIREVLALGVAVIAAGGGGIPVVEREGQLEGVEAVVDKDLATAMLAIGTDAHQMMLVTGAPGIYENFERPGARLLTRTSPEELQRLADDGHFPPGSMGPKVAAMIQFVQATGRCAVVCQPSDLAAALAGEAGTVVEPVS